MGFMDKMNAKGQEMWEQSFKTEEDLRKAEAQGVDVSHIRARLEKEWAEEKLVAVARFGNEGYDPAALPNPIDLDRLNPYRSTPRNENSPFVMDSAGKPALFGLFGKDKHYKAVADAQLAYSAVVQAHRLLWKPSSGLGPMGMVLVFATDEAHRFDIAWLKSTANAIGKMKRSETVPADCEDFIHCLRNDQSNFTLLLPAGLNGGAKAWCVVHIVTDTNTLPKTYIPSEGIIPILIKEESVEKQRIDLTFVAPKYYMR